MTPRRAALAGLSLSTISIVAAYGSAFLPGGANRISALLMIFGIATMAISIMTLGSVRQGERLGILAYVFAFIFVVLLAGFAALMIMVRIEVERTENTGILRDWGPGSWLRAPISRDREPEAFADGLRWLRVMPWIAAAMVSFGILLAGLLL